MAGKYASPGANLRTLEKATPRGMPLRSVGTFHHVIVGRQNTVQFMTASTFHVKPI
jgi:hypothetical protein